jgi:hypothetical protein
VGLPDKKQGNGSKRYEGQDKDPYRMVIPGLALGLPCSTVRAKRVSRVDGLATFAARNFGRDARAGWIVNGQRNVPLTV